MLAPLNNVKSSAVEVYLWFMSLEQSKPRLLCLFEVFPLRVNLRTGMFPKIMVSGDGSDVSFNSQLNSLRHDLTS